VSVARGLAKADEGVIVAGERIAAGGIAWAAGVAASPAARWLACERDRAGRAKVAGDLSLPGHPDIFAIGDTALVLDAQGNPVPGVAPATKQQGAYVAGVIGRMLRHALRPAPFRCRNPGSMATIGRCAAVADFGWLRVSGLAAWLLWGVVHMLFLIGFRNRITILVEWLWAYVTFQRGARLITGT
jgi:NADH:ubiquinone reductase (H+-translocating)